MSYKLAAYFNRNLPAYTAIALVGVLGGEIAWSQTAIALPPYRPGQPVPVMVLNGIESTSASPQVVSLQVASNGPSEPVADFQDDPTPAPNAGIPARRSTESPAAVAQEARQPSPVEDVGERPRLQQVERESDRRGRGPEGRGPIRQRFGAPGMEPPTMEPPRREFETPRFDRPWMEQPPEVDRRSLDRPRESMDYRIEERAIVQHPPMHDIDAILASPAINKILKLTEEKLELQAEMRIAQLEHRHQRELQEIALRHANEELERRSMQLRQMQEELEQHRAQPAEESREANERRRASELQVQELKQMLTDRDVKLKEIGGQLNSHRRELEASQQEMEAMRAQRQELEHRARFLEARLAELEAANEERSAEKAERETKQERQPKSTQQEKKKPTKDDDKSTRNKKQEKNSSQDD